MIRPRWIWRYLLVSLFIGWSGLGCSRTEPAPLRVGNVVWPGYEPFYVARQLGYLDARQVRLMEYTGNSEIIRAFANDTIDAGMMTLDEALLLAEDVPDIRLVLVTDISNGADVIMAKAEIESFKGLRGRRVGAETSALGSYVLLRALEISGMTPEDVVIVPLDPAEHEAALLQGRVDAVVTYEPSLTKLLTAGARKVFDSSQIPGEVVDVVVVRAAYLEAHPETVRYLLQAFYHGRDYFTEKPLEAAKIAASRAKISPEEFLSSLHGLPTPDANESRRMLTGQEPTLLKDAQRLAGIMRKKGLLRKDVDTKALFADASLARLLP